MYVKGERDLNAEISSFLAEQQAELAKFNEREEARRLQESRAAEAEINANIEREQTALARSRQFLKQKLSIRYNEETASEICRRVADGEVLVNICADQLMPPMSTVQDWLEDEKYTSFQKAYLKACTRRAMVFEDQLISISDDSTNDYMDKLNARTGESFRVLDPESLGRSKLRIEMRQAILKANDPVKWAVNPTVANVNKAANVDRRPNVIMHFHEAPAMPAHPGDRAKVIEHEQVAIVAPSKKQEKVA